MLRRPVLRLTAAAGAILLLSSAAAPAAATVVPDRTTRVSTGPSGPDPNATSRHAAISGDGRFVAFDSDATELAPDGNGIITDVYLRDVVGTTTGIVSRAPGGPAGNGPSTTPAINGDGTAVAFVSSATNLVLADLNDVDDVLVRTPRLISRASVSSIGLEGNAASFQPDISADGRYVAFASDATNLAPDDTNGQTDVFVRDTQENTTILVSRAEGGQSAAGSSSQPAISPDGRHVSFTSDAADLVPGDRNVAADVFLADLQTAIITRVSVDDDGREQDDATRDPFLPVSDVSGDGRFVVFDSDATRLVRRDTNRATDVFLHDTVEQTTRRVSVDGSRRQGDNDSFFPTITPDGRYVAYESFAGNIARHDTRREDLFIYDRKSRLPALIDVPSSGARKGAERLRQLLQRPSLSADGTFAAFSSTAANLVADTGGVQDVFVRALAAPVARIGMQAFIVDQRALYRIVADDPKAKDFRCTMDRRPFTCGAVGRLPRYKARPHVLRVQAGGPGMLWQATPVVRRFIIR